MKINNHASGSTTVHIECIGIHYVDRILKFNKRIRYIMLINIAKFLKSFGGELWEFNYL